jgi:O-antigen/teichoic acid export membrane protein
MPPEQQPPSLYRRFRNLADAKTVTVQASALVAGKWVQDGFGFLLLLWLARTNQSGFGLFIFGAGVAGLIRSFLTLGFDQFTIRELALDSESQGRVLGQMIRLKLFIGLPLLAIALAFGRLQGWSRAENLVVLIICTGQVLLSVADTLFSFYRFAGIQVQEAACSVKASLIGALYGAVMLFTGSGVVAISLFVVIAHGFKVILAAMWGRKARILPKIRWERSILPQGRLGAMLLIAGVSFLGSFYIQIQILLLKHFRPIDDLALYGVAIELAGGLASMVSTFIIGGVIYPSLARSVSQGSGQFAAFIQTYFWRLAAIGLGIAFFYVTLGKDLLLLLYGLKYTGSVVPLQILGLATLFSFVSNFLIYAFLAQHQERLLCLLHLAPAFLSLGLGFFLIPLLGASGAALNLLVCRVALSCLILAVAHWRFGIFRKKLVAAFLGGGLALGSTYGGLWAVGFPAAHFASLFVLLGYGWWTWHWTMNSGLLPKVDAGAGYEAS